MTLAEVYEALGKQDGLREDGGVDSASIFIFFHPKAQHICYNNSNIVKF